MKGLARSNEFRVGGSASPWKGAWIDGGATRLERRNAIAASHTVSYHPNIGFEQVLRKGRYALRLGIDETSPAAGFSYKFAPFKLDAAYVDNMAKSRVGDLFGTSSYSFIVMFTVDYKPKHPRAPTKAP